MAKKLPGDIWNDLNPRQQHYLQCIFDIDQEEEKYQKSLGAQGRYDEVTPASEWRWMTYTPTTADDRLHTRIGKKHIDPGTGSTLKALETRGLIETKAEHAGTAIGGYIVYVKITTLGRKVIRAARPELKPPPKLKTGQLRSYHWEALEAAYKAGDDGVQRGDSFSSYGGFTWNTWLRLRDYQLQGKHHPLVAEHQISPWPNVQYVMRITDKGRRFYEANLEEYMALYPEIYQQREAKRIAQERQEIEQRRRDGIKRGMDRARKRGKLIGRPAGAESREAFLAKYPEVIEALRAGMSIRKTSDKFGISTRTVQDVKRLMDEKAPE